MSLAGSGVFEIEHSEFDIVDDCNDLHAGTLSNHVAATATIVA